MNRGAKNHTRSSNPDTEKKRSPVALWKAMRRLLVFSRPYRSRLIAAVLLTLGSAAIWLIVPLGLRTLLDAVFESGNRTMLNKLTLVLIALFLVQSFLSFSGRYLLGWTGGRVVTDLRKRLFEHLNRLDLKFFSNQRTGEITSRLTNDVGTIREAVTNALVELVSQLLNLIGSMALMLVLNWRLSLVIYAIVPAVTLFS